MNPLSSKTGGFYLSGVDAVVVRFGLLAQTEDNLSVNL